ncbi:MAG: hypothetical protein E7417_01355 [Ruminococcaceae bacterium]|nr:hypothetical protein [Oscillospiraceae bacterium]
MKKLIAALLLITSTCVASASAAPMILEYDGSIRNYSGNIYDLEVNGKMLTNLPLEPIIFNERALVPVREIFEAMGAVVTYNDSEKSVTITNRSTTVYLVIDSPTAKVNGGVITIPDNVAPKLIAKWGESAKTMVPVRFISESLGMKVDFSQEKGLISISDPTMVAPQRNAFEKITWSQEGNVVTVAVTATKEITSYTYPYLTNTGVLYSDISDITFITPESTEVNVGGVLRVRMGIHGANSRIAIDTVDTESYTIALSPDKKTIIFKIAQKGGTPVPPVQTTPTTPTTPTPPAEPTPVVPQYFEINLENPLVVIDAGHGGKDPGVVRNKLTDQELSQWLAHKASPTPNPSDPILAGGTGSVYNEKDVALAITLKTKRILEENGVRVLLTREGDTYPTLDERPDLAAANHAALFISIHANATNDIVSTANGIEIYYSLENNNDNYTLTSEAFAKEVLQNVITATGARNRGVKTANYRVVRKSPMPAALIETGFFNNPEEFNLLISDDYQEKIAYGIAIGIINSLPKLRLNPNLASAGASSQLPLSSDLTLQDVMNMNKAPVN